MTHPRDRKVTFLLEYPSRATLETLHGGKPERLVLPVSPPQPWMLSYGDLAGLLALFLTVGLIAGYALGLLRVFGPRVIP